MSLPTTPIKLLPPLPPVEGRPPVAFSISSKITQNDNCMQLLSFFVVVVVIFVVVVHQQQRMG